MDKNSPASHPFFNVILERNTKELLIKYAAEYETADFLAADPSWFMHQVACERNQEAMAFLASCLSYGGRKQFFPKIQFILDSSHGDVYEWVRRGLFVRDIPDDGACYYRLYTRHAMNELLSALQALFLEHGTLGRFVERQASDGYAAVAAISAYFAEKGSGGIVPKNTTSACKRLCMFLRWMVRDASPVDLGLWSDFIDKRTLVMPMDTHVQQEAARLALLSGSSATMAAARRLTERMAEAFPDDPLKGDFALFGYGVNKGRQSQTKVTHPDKTANVRYT